MPADASIYANYLRAPKTVQEYDAEAMQQQGNALALAQQRMQMNALQRQQADDSTYKDVARGFSDDFDSNYKKLIAAGLPRQAAEYRKAALEGEEKRSKINKEQGETLDGAIKRYRDQLSYIESPQAVARWYQAQYADPILGKFMASHGTIEQALQEVPQDPAQFKAWRDQIGMGLDAYSKKLQKDRELANTEANSLVGPDGKVNTTLLNAKKQVAQAGASSVNISTGQKGLDNEFKLRGEFKGEPVYKAHQEMQSAYNQIKQALGQATPAGDLAGATKIMKLLDPGSVVRESELGMAMQATGLMDRLDNYATNIINGTKLTPKQRQEFQQLANALYGESVKQYNAKRDEYERLGGEYGLNSGRAIGPRANLAAKPQSPSNVVDFGSLK